MTDLPSNTPRSTTVSFADVAHQTLIFDRESVLSRMILELIDTPWMQRLRAIRQTGNTNLVYMFSEHSRFGHSLGVAFLAMSLMEKLKRNFSAQIEEFELGVGAAALLHDLGHVAPGSHLAERLWAPDGSAAHEKISTRIIADDSAINHILRRYQNDLPELVVRILSEDDSLPRWTTAVISGGGWNADRGNWAIVDSAMCSVHYGRYNVSALIDAFSLTPNGELVLQESRLDALTHFFVARDSMYRQVYQHRVLQAADLLTERIVLRVRDLLRNDRGEPLSHETVKSKLSSLKIFADEVMIAALCSKSYALELPLAQIFQMTEPWWSYHISQWCGADDSILRELASRLRDRRLFKTVRVQHREEGKALMHRASELAQELGFDPRYYVSLVHNFDKHRSKKEAPPSVVLDSGAVVPATTVEPLIQEIIERSESPRAWLVVPKEIKEKLGRFR